MGDEACEDVTSAYITVNRMDCSGECVPVENIQHSLMAPSRCHITWDASLNQTKWDVHYRIQGTTAWTRVGALSPEKTLHSLEPNTVYQYIVRPFCGTWDFALASPVRRFNTANIPLAVARAKGLSNDITNLSPNPTRNLLRVEFSTAVQSDVNLSIVDLTGKVLRQITVGNAEDVQTETIDVSNLTEGYYLLVMQTANDRIVKKFAKIP